METTVTFEYGPMTVEIHAFEGDKYQDEVLDLVRFIENHQDRLDELGSVNELPGVLQSKTETTSLDEFSAKEDNEEDSEGPLDSIASKIRTSPTNLERFLDVDPDGKDSPVIYVDEIGELGDRQTDRQRAASLILLYLWHECYDETRVKSSALKDALEMSSISSSGMANMYQGEGDRFFDRRGRGPTATVRLTPPGQREAKKVLRRFAKREDEE